MHRLLYAKVYSENKKYLKRYEKSKDPDRYYRTHGDEIEMATGALHHLKNAGLDPDKINLSQMEKDHMQMTSDREKTYAAYKSSQKEYSELKKLRDNLEIYTDSHQAIDRDNSPSMDH